MSDVVISGQRGRAPGPGVIRCEESRYQEFAGVWNSAKAVKDAEGKTLKNKSTVILEKLRELKIANEHTDEAQVRAFASKVRNYVGENPKCGFELHINEVKHLNRKQILVAWMRSKSPSEAFQKCIDLGVFGAVTDENRQLKLQSFRACIAQLKKSIPSLKKMGKSRASKINDEKFIEIWNSSDSVSEVKDKLVAAGLIGDDYKLSALKGKANTLRNGKEAKDDKPAVAGIEMKKLQSREDIADLQKLAQRLAAGEDIGDDDIADDDDDDDEENGETAEDDEDAEPDESDEADDDLGDLAADK